MARGSMALLTLVILILRHDTVNGQGGKEAELQAARRRLDVTAWLNENGAKVRSQ